MHSIGNKMPWSVNLLASPWYMLIEEPPGALPSMVPEYVSVLLLTVGLTVGKALVDLDVVRVSDFWICEGSTAGGAAVGTSVTALDLIF